MVKIRPLRIVRRTVVVVLVAIAAVLAVLHVPAVQRAIWDEVRARIAAATGWDLRLEDVSVRLWPARLEVSGLTVTAPERSEPLIGADRASATWRWTRLLAAPRRLDTVSVTGLAADTAQLPPPSPSRPAEPQPEGWLPSLVIGTVEIDRSRVVVPTGVAGLRLTGVALSGTLAGDSTRADVTADRVEAVREGRTLALGALDLALGVTRTGLTVERATLRGDRVTADARASVDPATHDQVVRATFDVGASLPEVLTWWDPTVAERLDPGGAVTASGSLRWSADAGVGLTLDGSGTGIRLAGYAVETFRIETPAGEGPVITAAGAGWGRVTAGPVGGAAIPVSAVLRQAPMEPLRLHLPKDVAARVPHSAVASGSVEAVVPLPFDPGTLDVTADLRVAWPRGSAAAAGSWRDGRATADRLTVALAGARAALAGSATPGRSLEVSGSVSVPDPAALLAELRRWLDVPETIDVAGGPVEGAASASGPWADPEITARLSWQQPLLAGRQLGNAVARATGTFSRASWTVDADTPAEHGGTLRGSGSLSLSDHTAAGTWTVASTPAPVLVGLAVPDRPLPLAGDVSAMGSFAAAPGGWNASAAVHWERAAWNDWHADRVDAQLSLSPDSARLERFRLERGTGVVVAEGALAPLTADGRVDLRLAWAHLAPSMTPFAAPAALDGTFSGSAELSGTLAAPGLSAEMLWDPATEPAALGPLTVTATIADGTLTATSRAFATSGGPARFRAALPLGDLPRPAWLWRDAPTGPATFSLDAARLDVVPIAAALGRPMPGFAVRTAVGLEGRWRPGHPDETHAELRLTDLEADLGREVLRGIAPIVARLDGRTVTVERARLIGVNSEATLSGTVDLGAGTIDATVGAEVAPAIVEMFSPVIAVRRPIAVTADLKGPLRHPTGHLHVSHDGTIAIMDPPVEIKDVDVALTLSDGVVDVDEGSATVNRGSVQLAGGWNPAQEQGVVFQIDSVTFILEYGIITQWDGLVALEPRPRGRMAVVGELTLDHGLWDRPFDITGTLLSGEAPVAPPAPDSLLSRIGLDLDVIGRAGIQVDNNLGQMELQWQRLGVAGTLEQPVLQGQIRILPEGDLLLTGSRVAITRGTIDFPGEPGAEPRVEIITEQPLVGGTGSGSTQSVDYARIAQVGLLRSVGKVFGLENSRIEPIDIATETEANPSSTLSVAKVISDHAVLFLTTNLAEVQQQTTLLQLYNWSGLPGFAVQLFSSSKADVGDGAAVLERYRFGGTVPRRDQRPRIGAVRIAGDWPVSTRAMRKATQFVKGQSFDPFLVFVGQVRLEHAMAERGYPDAEVTGTVSGEQIEPTLEFRVAPGPHYAIGFTGADLPKSVKERIRGLFQPGPFAASSLAEMRAALVRELAVMGYPKASVTVSEGGEGITLAIEPGPEMRLSGLRLQGAPAAVEQRTGALIPSPAILAALADGDPAALQRLERILADQGYPAARVISTDIVTDEDADEHVVRAVVDLGPRATVAAVEISGRDPLDIRSRPGFPIAAGMPLSSRLVDDAVRFVRHTYREAGYPDVEAHAETRMEGGDGRVVLSLDAGEEITVASVTVSGLRYLKESVIREGVEIDPGAPLRLSQVDATAANIASFPPVASVEVRRHDHGRSTDVEIAIKEKLRWTVGAGVRWSTENREELLLDLRDDDLLGRGLGANLRGHYGSRSKAGQFYLSLPPLPGGRLAFGGGASYSRIESAGDVTEKTVVLTLDGTLYESAVTQLRGYLRRERTRRADASPGPESPALSITTLGTVGGQFVTDRRDDPFNPTRGWYGALDVSYSPRWLRSDDQVLRGLLAYSRADTMGDRWILAQGLRLGASKAYGGPLPLTRSARFFAGGESTVRGFIQDSIGPREVGADADGDPVTNYLGGGALFILNEEIRYVLSDRFVLAAFADSGQVWRSWSQSGGRLSVGAGVGLRIMTPVGPGRIDVAWPVGNTMGQTGPRYYIGIGQAF